MGRYSLGIDVGTTYTAAAVQRDGRAEMMPLGSTNVIVPTVVLLREDGEVLVGESAERRSVAEPSRVAREFKRRMGDPTPIVVGGTPYGAEALLTHVVRAVVREATSREGGPPDHVVLTHPASWSTFKLDLMAQAARAADLTSVSFLTEPQAAATYYASQSRLEIGATIAVYDLGGGTFDAAVVRRTATGFDLLGIPEGMERFGGIDIDRAVMAHVDDVLAGELAKQADAGDPSVAAALVRVRDDVRTAKEALSNDSDAVIPVLLPGLNTEVRITRGELENMIRPRLTETIDTLHRTVRSAGLDWGDLTAVLIVGGSSRIPLVREVIRDRTGRPVVVDAHPKHAIALGAAGTGWNVLHASAALAPPALAPPALAPTPPVAAPGAPAASASAATASTVRGRSRRSWMIAGASAVVILVGGVVLATRGGGSATIKAAAGTHGSTTSVPSSPAPPSTVPPSTEAATSAPPTSPVTTVAATSPTTPSAPTQRVSDSTGSFAVSLPADMVTNAASITLGGVAFAHVSGSTDLNGYLAGSWASPGVSVLATDSSLITPSGAAASLRPAACTVTSGEQPYSTPSGNGVLVEYDSCGGGNFSETIIAVEVPAAHAVVLVGGTGPGPANAGLTARLEAILASVRSL